MSFAGVTLASNFVPSDHRRIQAQLIDRATGAFVEHVVIERREDAVHALEVVSRKAMRHNVSKTVAVAWMRLKGAGTSTGGFLWSPGAIANGIWM